MELAKNDSTLERTYKRRAVRARRSKWLGSLLLSLGGMALVMVLRMNPSLATDVVAWAHDTQRKSPARSLTKPAEIHVRIMPRNVVPVRHGGVLPRDGNRVPENSIQVQLTASADALNSATPSQ
jgi:hypothetical protein